MLLFFIHVSDLHSLALLKAEAGFGAAQHYRFITVKTKPKSKPA